MKCPVCNNSARPMYCAHCMNTSPNLLVRLRVNLFILRETNCQLKNKVEAILEFGLNKVEKRNEGPAGVKKQEESTNIEGEILGSRLQKVDLLRLRKKNNRIKYRITLEQKKISDKRRSKELIQQELQQYLRPRILEQTNTNSCEYEGKLQETGQQISQVQKVVTSTQSLKLKKLTEWFIIRKRESYEFPYSIAFQPIVSLKNFYKLPSMVAWNSISKMSHYMTLLSDILLFRLSCELGEPPRIFMLEAEECDDPNIDESIVGEYLAKLVINVLQVSRHLNLLSKDPLDLVWLLDQYDLDTIFYNMVTGQEMKSRPVSHHWTYTRVLAVVSEALQFSIYAASPASRPTLAGTIANNSDKWYLVG